MNTLVTGGAGFIGSNLALKLEELGHRVVAVDDLSVGNMKNLDGFKGTFVKADITEIDWEKEVGGKVDVVFHEAAITDTTYPDDERMMEVNAESFSRLLDFASARKARMVYATSAATYGAGKVPMKESQKPEPMNSYAVSKVGMEKAAAKYSGRFKCLVGLRYFNVFGPRESFKGKASSMIYQLAVKMMNGEKPRLFKYGEQVRDHIYVKDIVGANLKAMEFEGCNVFNVGTGKPTSFNRIVEVLNELLGKNFEIEYFDNPLKVYQATTQADTKKAESVLGWKSHYSFEEGVEDYLGFIRAAEK